MHDPFYPPTHGANGESGHYTETLLMMFLFTGEEGEGVTREMLLLKHETL